MNPYMLNHCEPHCDQAERKRLLFWGGKGRSLSRLEQLALTMRKNTGKQDGKIIGPSGDASVPRTPLQGLPARRHWPIDRRLTAPAAELLEHSTAPSPSSVLVRQWSLKGMAPKQVTLLLFSSSPILVSLFCPATRCWASFQCVSGSRRLITVRGHPIILVFGTALPIQQPNLI